MTIAVLPLSTQRTDARRGIAARRIAAWLAARLAAGGASAQYVPWFVTRGDAVAHVVIEGHLPDDAVDDEADAIGAQTVVTGVLARDHEAWHITLQVRSRTHDEVQSIAAQGIDLRAAMLDALARLSTILDVDAEPGHVPQPGTALDAWLADADNAALVERGGLSALSCADDAWTHLRDAIAADPAHGELATLLLARIERWRHEGHHALALAASAGLADVARDPAASWTRHEQLAEALGDEDAREHALRRRVALSPDDAEARLRLGVFLVRRSRSHEALTWLTEAAHDEARRDAAETYLGVALASVGRLSEAVEIWRRVVDEAGDPGIVAIARENLQRAEPG